MPGMKLTDLDFHCLCNDIGKAEKIAFKRPSAKKRKNLHTADKASITTPGPNPSPADGDGRPNKVARAESPNTHTPVADAPPCLTANHPEQLSTAAPLPERAFSASNRPTLPPPLSSDHHDPPPAAPPCLTTNHPEKMP